MKTKSIIEILSSQNFGKEKDIYLELAGWKHHDLSVVLLIDVSGSMLKMHDSYSRMDHAVSLAVICKEIFEDVSIYATSGNQSKKTCLTEKVPNYSGFALANAIRRGTMALYGDGCFPNTAINFVTHYEVKPDIFILISDGEHDDVGRGFSLKHDIYINMGTNSGPEKYSTFPTIESFFEWLRDLSMN